LIYLLLLLLQVYELLAHQSVREEHPDLREDALRVLPLAAELSHNLELVGLNPRNRFAFWNPSAQTISLSS
jgi:hypothetical protein